VSATGETARRASSAGVRTGGSRRARRDRRLRHGLPSLLLLLPALLAAALALLPLVYLMIRAFQGGAGPVLEIVARERTVRLVLRSLALAVVVTGACSVIGISLAWLTVRARLPGRGWWMLLAAMPLAIPTYVAAFAWLAAVPGLHGFAGAALVLTACSYPYVYLPVAAALQRVDPGMEEVARGLGRNPLATFATVTLRQVRPAAAGGALLVCLYVLSDFGAVSLMRYDAFTRVIYTSYKASFDRTPAAVLGLVLVAVTVLIVWGESRARGRGGEARVGAGAARVHFPVALGVWTWPALAWAGAVALVSLVVPLGSMTYWLLRGRSAALEPALLIQAATSTLGVAALGALVTTALAVPVGVLAARHRSRLARMLEQATYAGHALPGIVVAFGLVFFGIRYAEPLYQRTPLLVLAYAVLFLPAAVGAVRASVRQSPPLLEEVARSLGRSSFGVLRAVTLPLAAPGVAAGAALVFLTCMKELPATLLLRPTGMQTLATRLWTETGSGSYAAAAPYAAALVLLAALPTWVLGRSGRRGASGRSSTLSAAVAAQPGGAAS
jgi:iron(III) transport system permease protein